MTAPILMITNYNSILCKQWWICETVRINITLTQNERKQSKQLHMMS
jgi:hypothetical protein